MFKFIGFLVALGIAFWVYSDARSRGLSAGKALLWFLGTLFLLIIFLPFWLITRPDKNNDVTAGGKPTLCPHCGKYYDGTPNYCPNCGRQVR